MSAGWVAATVRARALAGRRMGPEARARLATPSAPAEALGALAHSPYAAAVRDCTTWAGARRAVARSALWNVRVLAGWAPPGGVDLLRLAAAWYELANIEDRWAALRGAEVPPPFELGALAAVWPRAARAGTVTELRTALAASPWGDPGTGEPGLGGVALRLAWAGRLAGAGPAAAGPWAAGQAALMAAVLVADGAAAGLPPAGAATARRLLGAGWSEAAGLADLADRVARPAAWALAGVGRPDDLWRAQLRWWERVEADGVTHQRGAVRPGADPVFGVAMALVADAWQVGAALDRTGGPGARERAGAPA